MFDLFHRRTSAECTGLSRRDFLRVGGLSALGLSLATFFRLQQQAAASETRPTRRSDVNCILLWMHGGPSHIDTLDPKPDAPAEIRGEFRSIPTVLPGVRVCEHLPLLASRSDRWALVRSLTHKSNDHSASHHIMLTGRSDLPPGFNPSQPRPTDHPSIAAIAGAVTQTRNNLPPAIVLPDKIVHNTGRVIPGQFAGVMGHARDPWFLEASAFEPRAYGAFPEYEFDHQEREYTAK